MFYLKISYSKIVCMNSFYSSPLFIPDYFILIYLTVLIAGLFRSLYTAGHGAACTEGHGRRLYSRPRPPPVQQATAVACTEGHGSSLYSRPRPQPVQQATAAACTAGHGRRLYSRPRQQPVQQATAATCKALTVH